MEAISFLSDWITWLLLIIPVTAGCMVTYFALRKSLSSDDSSISDFDKKIRYTIIGAVICVTISGFITIVKSFYL